MKLQSKEAYCHVYRRFVCYFYTGCSRISEFNIIYQITKDVDGPTEKVQEIDL